MSSGSLLTYKTSRRWLSMPVLCLLSVSLGLLTLGYLATSSHSTWQHTSTSIRPGSSFAEGFQPRMMRLSMNYDHGKPDYVYERALNTHREHCARWGERFVVDRSDAMRQGFWNKAQFVLHMIESELIKPGHERVEWVMWVDADSIILNPLIPASIFLPVADLDHINAVVTRDHNGLNSGIFYLRVSEWSVTMLVKALAMPLYATQQTEDTAPDQTAMGVVLSEASYQDGTIYIPRQWINTYQFGHGYEGSKGDMLVHFPGLQEQRKRSMVDWLEQLEAFPDSWTVDLERTKHWNNTRAFWNDYRESRRLLRVVDKEFADQTDRATNDVLEAASDLRASHNLHADDIEKIQELQTRLKKALD